MVHCNPQHTAIISEDPTLPVMANIVGLYSCLWAEKIQLFICSARGVAPTGT